jgi:prepilin-type N-terminal cleavage/methylation domain-containing protein
MVNRIRGYTLTEMVVVLVIIAILAGMFIYIYLKI